jgi:hypothetical protein
MFADSANVPTAPMFDAGVSTTLEIGTYDGSDGQLDPMIELNGAPQALPQFVNNAGDPLAPPGNKMLPGVGYPVVPVITPEHIFFNWPTGQPLIGSPDGQITQRSNGVFYYMPPMPKVIWLPPAKPLPPNMNYTPPAWEKPARMIIVGSGALIGAPYAGPYAVQQILLGIGVYEASTGISEGWW